MRHAKIKAQAEYVCWRDSAARPAHRPKKNSFTGERVLPAADPGELIAHRWRKSFCFKGETGFGQSSARAARRAARSRRARGSTASPEVGMKDEAAPQAHRPASHRGARRPRYRGFAISARTEGSARRATRSRILFRGGFFRGTGFSGVFNAGAVVLLRSNWHAQLTLTPPKCDTWLCR
jgi:hypothetical protein